MSELKVVINEAKITSKMRAETYQWFARIFSSELSGDEVKLYEEGALNTLLSLFTEMGLSEEVKKVQAAIDSLKQIEHVELELKADFAGCFLLDEASGAIPYASIYLGDGDMLYAEAERKMREILSKSGLQILDSFKEPSDHLSIYLSLMQKWCEQLNKDLRTETVDRDLIESEYIAQATFINEGILSWLPIWNERLSRVANCKCQFYVAMGDLLVAYITADYDYMSNEVERLIALNS